MLRRSPAPRDSRRTNKPVPVMTAVTTRTIRIAAALTFCLGFTRLADVPLLAGAAARVTCADCPVLSVNPQASRPLGRAANSTPCRVQTRNGLPLPDPKCTPGAINPTVTLAVLGDRSFRTGCLRNCATTQRDWSATYRRYGIQHPKGNSGRNQICELDHLVPLEMGGADTIENIWPQCGPAIFQTQTPPRDPLTPNFQRQVFSMRHSGKIIHAAFLLACLIALPTITHAETITGRVVRVLDGDTVAILTPQKEQVRVRLAEIDAPEKNQPFGMSAKKMLSDLIFARDVSVVKIDTDRYGRTVGRIYQGQTDVNLEMVKAGGAWAYTKYLTDSTFRTAEDAARAGKRGLWDLQEDQRIPPWEWRKQQRAGIPSHSVEKVWRKSRSSARWIQ